MTISPITASHNVGYGYRYYRCLVRVTSSHSAIACNGVPIQPPRHWATDPLAEAHYHGKAYTHIYVDASASHHDEAHTLVPSDQRIDYR